MGVSCTRIAGGTKQGVTPMSMANTSASPTLLRPIRIVSFNPV
jgi:hypothetical protein